MTESPNVSASTPQPVRAIWHAPLFQPRGLSAQTAVILIAAGTLGYFQLVHPGVASFFVLVAVMSEFVRRMDIGLPLMQITAAIATLQWLVGPSLTYYLGLVHGRYFMYVPDTVYFTFALPATCVYCLSVLSFGSVVNQKRLVARTDRSHYFGVGITLVAISFVSQVAAGSMPGGLAFAFHLGSQLRYVGVLYFLFSNHRWRYLFAIASCLPLFFASAENGMFHDLILWMAMITSVWIAKFRWTLRSKLAFLGAGMLCVFVIQVIKQDYRDKLQAGENPSLIAEIASAMTGQRFLEDDVLTLATARLNQGWIISAVMWNVPKFEPFAEGETIKTAVVAALVPRLLNENKKGAGGQENFKRFTGLPINKGTSMGISPLGEAYANFRVEGGIAFMAVFGGCFGMLYYFVVKRVVHYPDLLFWIPLIFYQGIKAETEMIVVLNQLVKGSLIVAAGYLALHHVLLPIMNKQGPRRPVRLPARMPVARRY